MFYASSTGGFYSREIHGNSIPKDAVAITDEQHAALIEGQSSGKQIVPDKDGKPTLQDPPAPTAEELTEQAASQRAAAYVKEADPLFFKSQRGEATREEWLAKVQEIKGRYPKP